jgi:hypothetical protein
MLAELVMPPWFVMVAGVEDDDVSDGTEDDVETET